MQIQGTVSGYIGLDKAIVIPPEINGFSVTYIGNYAFSGNRLTSVTIGANVSIHNESFYHIIGKFYNENGKKAAVYTLNKSSYNLSYSAR